MQKVLNFEEFLNEDKSSEYLNPEALAAAVAEAHPELTKLKGKEREDKAFEFAHKMMTDAKVSKTAIGNLISGAADEDWPSDYINALSDILDKK